MNQLFGLQHRGDSRYIFVAAEYRYTNRSLTLVQLNSTLPKSFLRSISHCCPFVVRLLFDCCPIVVRLKNGQQTYIKRTSIAQE